MRALLETLQNAIVDYNSTLPRKFLKAHERLTPRKQINIYAHAYKDRLLGILAEDYPLLQKHIGKRKFKALAEAYIAEQPPKVVDLGIYSRGFAESLKHKHNQVSPKIIRLAAVDAAELALLDMESLPAFQPAPDTGLEKLLAMKLMVQPASVFIEGKMLYRIGTQILEQPVSEDEGVALRELGETSSLQEWAEQLPPASAAQVSQWLPKWISQSMLAHQK